MPQYIRPNSDLVTNVNWTTTPYFEKLDEVSFDDADFVSCGNSNNAAFELGLSSASNPQSGTRTLRVRCKKGGSGGNTRGLNFNLKENGTTVQSGTVNANLTEVYTTIEIVITNSITNYSTLSLELASTGTTGGAGTSRRTVEVSWVEFEIPDQESVIYNESINEIIDITDINTSLYNGLVTLIETTNILDNNIGGLTFNEAISEITNIIDQSLGGLAFNESITFTINGVSSEMSTQSFFDNILFNTDIIDSYETSTSKPNTLIIKFKIRSS
jgi:hypothetical protein